jgi:putative ABC transport system ATP-binding protein
MTRKQVAQVRNVVKELGEDAGKVRAVDDVSLTLQAGELTLLMGPSGSGKTTLISMLGCILSPTSGKVIIAGQDTTGMRPDQLAQLRRNHIGFIFQSYNLFPTLSATENVVVALDVRGMRRAEAKEKAIAALKSVGLGHRLNSFPKKMSGGEQQRVAVARAIAGSPSLILADEPTAALDSENGHAVMALLAEIAHKEEQAVLAVTHDPRTLSYADRVLRIEDGRIIDDERPSNSGSTDTRHHATRKRKRINA